jgi:tetratricopeptide (TPR) repeat protein
MERNNNKRMDRAMVQLNHLVDAFDEFDNESKKNNKILLENMKYFYGILLTPRWTVQRNLGDTLCSLGCIKSALDVYQELKAWEQMVHCYQTLDRKNKAEEVVRQQIEIQGETPFLLCLLADATDDHLLYQRAWDASNGKYFRAKRDLGNYFFRRKEYDTCKQHYQDSLKLNSLQIGVWQRLGFAALDTQDYELAVKAYRRFVEFEPDVFEAWNNLAKAYIKLDRKIIAYSTLQEAIKCNFEEWRLWENYLTVSVDVGSFDEVIRSWHRLIDLKGKFEDDTIVQILVRAVLEDVKDINGNAASRMSARLLQLLARIKGTAYNSFRLWISYARLLVFLEKDLDSVVDVVRRANRCIIQIPNWDKEPSRVQTVLDNIQESLQILVDASVRESNEEKRKAALSSAKLSVHSIVRAAEKSLSSWDPTKVDLKSLNLSLENIQMLTR